MPSLDPVFAKEQYLNGHRLPMPTSLHGKLSTIYGVMQGTIHILRKHLYSIKLNLTSKFFIKIGFFHQNKRIYFSTLHFDKIFILKVEIFSMYLNKMKNAQKMLENVAGDKKKVLT